RLLLTQSGHDAWSQLFTFQQLSCACCTHSNIVATSFRREFYWRPCQLSNPDHRRVPAHIRLDERPSACPLPAWRCRRGSCCRWSCGWLGSGTFSPTFCNVVFFRDLGRLICGLVSPPFLLARFDRFLLSQRGRYRKSRN